MSQVDPIGQSWERWFRALPFLVLLVAAAIATATGPATGWTEPGWRLTAQLVVLAATFGCLSWWTFADPGPRYGRFYYVLRTVLAGILTLLNPLYCIFAWIGYIDADDHFRGRAVTTALGATAVVMALGQSGGLPWDDLGQAVLFGMLLVVNYGLAFVMSRWAVHTTEVSEQRAAMITELERALEENAELHAQLVDQARATGIEEERRRLAGEIHDTIAQTLAAVLAQLQAALDDPVAGRDRVQRATELARDALTQARRSVTALAPVELSESELPRAVRGLVDSWAAEHGVAAEAIVTGTVRPLHAEIEATVLRITQEALSNIAKHARAGRVGVTLSYDEDEVIVDVRDDGIGFDLEPGPAASSFGLRGMRWRAERLAGSLTVETEPDSGTAISLRLPALEQDVA